MSEDTERRSTQAYAILPLRKSKTYRTRNGQDAQQEEKAQDGRSQHGKRRCHIMAQEKNSLSLCLRVLMIGFKGMRMHHDNPVHHMRVGKQGNASPIHQEQQGKKKLHNTAQSFQK